jgi:uncharacterized membrane protein
LGAFKHTVVIRCPVDKAFDYVADWQNLKSFMSNILDITPVSYVHSGPGAAYDTVFKVGGANILTTLEVTEYARNKKLMLKSRQGLKIIGGWEFKTAKEGVSIAFSLQYELPKGYIRNERDKVLVEEDFDEASSQSLQLLKWILESQTIQSDNY